ELGRNVRIGPSPLEVFLGRVEIMSLPQRFQELLRIIGRNCRSNDDRRADDDRKRQSRDSSLHGLSDAVWQETSSPCAGPLVHRPWMFRTTCRAYRDAIAQPFRPQKVPLP